MCEAVFEIQTIIIIKKTENIYINNNLKDQKRKIYFFVVVVGDLLLHKKKSEKSLVKMLFLMFDIVLARSWRYVEDCWGFGAPSVGSNFYRYI
jgi:hypothetical protein